MKRPHAFTIALIILLISLGGLFCFMIVSTPPAAERWEVQGNGHAYYLLAGSDDRLYVFHNDEVTAIKNNGAIAWNFQVPDGWKVTTLAEAATAYNEYLTAFGDRPVASESKGMICLCLYSIESLKDILDEGTGDPGSGRRLQSKIVAISPQGNVAWEYDFSTRTMPWANYGSPGSPAVQAYDGGAYLFQDYAEEVLNSNGRLLTRIDNASAPGAIDEDGNVYIVRASRADAAADDLQDMIKTGTVEAYSRDGTLLWSRDIGEKIIGESYLLDRRQSLPLYINDRLYVPVSNGTAAMWTNGTICWTRHIAGYDSVVPFGLLPADEADNVLLAASNDGFRNAQIISIAPDGTASENKWSFSYDAPVAAARSDGTVYTMTYNTGDVSQAPEFAKLAELFKPDVLTASDIRTGERRWTFEVPGSDMQYLVLNDSNVDRAIPGQSPGADARKMNEAPDVYAGAPADSISLSTGLGYKIGVITSPNVTYMNYYVAIYESPIVFNRSECMYVNILYALDNDGLLLWKKPVDGLVMATAEGRGSIFYSTNDGKVRATPAGIAAGIALGAAACLFVRFLLLGTITRAKSKLEKNENRNEVLRYIISNPGVTAADISKNLRMNIGTIRYHLLVLTANRMVTTHKEGEKFLRYFKYYGTYNPADREYLSTIRRKPLRKILEALVESPVLTSPDLAKEMGLSVTSANFHINVLVDKGIIEKAAGTERGFAYSIKAEHRERIRELLGK